MRSVRMTADIFCYGCDMGKPFPDTAESGAK